MKKTMWNSLPSCFAEEVYRPQAYDAIEQEASSLIGVCPDNLPVPSVVDSS